MNIICYALMFVNFFVWSQRWEVLDSFGQSQGRNNFNYYFPHSSGYRDFVTRCSSLLSPSLHLGWDDSFSLLLTHASKHCTLINISTYRLRCPYSHKLKLVSINSILSLFNNILFANPLNMWGLVLSMII